MEKITKELINELMNSKNIAGFTSENALEFEDLLLTDYFTPLVTIFPSFPPSPCLFAVG